MKGNYSFILIVFIVVLLGVNDGGWVLAEDNEDKGNNTAEYTCLKKQIDTDATISCFEETVDILSKDRLGLIDAAAHRGDPQTNFHLSIRDIHLNMRANYKDFIEAVGKNIYPLIIATDSDTPELSGTGGAYKIYFRNGTMRRIVPVGPEFEIHKGLSHMVLGVWSIVAPYFKSPYSMNWKPKLQELQRKLDDASYLLNDSGLTPADQSHAKKMMTIVTDYITTALKTNSVKYQTYRKFGDTISPLIDHSMKIAAEAHVAGTIPALQQLKADLGETEWKKVYVVIPTVWPVSLYNLRLQVFRKVMDFQQIKQQVLIAEGAKNEDDARTTLGRIVGDRALAQLVFGGKNDQNMKDHVYSLSTRRDLLATVEEEALDHFCEGEAPEKVQLHPSGPKCPMSKLISTMSK